MTDHYPPELPPLVRRAQARLGRRLRIGAPTLAATVVEWTRSLSGGLAPDKYFTHPEAFPMLLLPWWFEEIIRGAPERRFQSDLVYSTVSGYYFVRMIDDLMDGEHPPKAEVLPALTVFHTEFIQTYHTHFAVGDAFWGALTASSLASAEMASRDAAKGAATRIEFIETSARKTVGALIPLAAVGHRHGRTELLDAWSTVVERLGRWHQMLNDMVGWHVDLDHGRRTFFLSGAPAGARTAVVEWVVDEGLAWGFGELEAWMDDTIAAASDLGSPPLLAYLAWRRRRLRAQREEMTRSLAAAALVLRTISSRRGGAAPEGREARSPDR